MQVILRGRITGRILLKVVRVDQNSAVIAIVLAGINRTVAPAIQPQHTQAVGAGCLCHGDGIGLAVGAVLRRNNEVHAAVGKVHRSVGGGNSGAGADGGGNGHLGQIRVIGQHKVIVAVLVQQSRAVVDGQARQVAGVVFQRLEAAAHRQILTFAVALRPRYAVQGYVGIAVQLVHELLSLHGGQGHGGCIVARVIVTDGGQNAHFLIIQIAQRLSVDIYTCGAADQVTRHRLGFLRAVLDGTGMVAVEYASHISAPIGIAVCVGNTYKAAHGGLFHLDGTLVIAVLHNTAQQAHQATGLLTGVDGAVVGAAGHNAHRVFQCALMVAHLSHYTADQTAAYDSTIVAAVHQYAGITGNTTDIRAAVGAKAGCVWITGNIAVVGAIGQNFAVTNNAAYHQCGNLPCRTGSGHLTIVNAVLNAAKASGCDAAHIGLGGNRATLIQNDALYHRTFAQHAEQAKIAGLRIVVDKVLDAMAAAVISTAKRITTRTAGGGFCNRRPIWYAGHVDIGSLPEIFARHGVTGIYHCRQAYQIICVFDQIRTFFRSFTAKSISNPCYLEKNDQTDTISIRAIGRN